VLSFNDGTSRSTKSPHLLLLLAGIHSKTEGDFMFNIGDVLWQLFYPALLVLLFVMVVKEVRFFIKLMPKKNNLDNKRDELHERLKKKDE
jgi:hypothetical protein